MFNEEPKPWQNKDEFLWLINKVEAYTKPLQSILEIGMGMGGSFKFWEELTEKKGLLIGIDNFSDCMTNQKIMEEKIKKNNWKVIIGNSQNSETVNQVLKFLNGKKLDLLFIDGDHEETVFKDYSNYSPLVRRGGLIIFHDCGEPSIFYHPKDASSTNRWSRGGDPVAKKCFEEIKAEKERLQYDQGTGIVYV